jgi:hypothetical protein
LAAPQSEGIVRNNTIESCAIGIRCEQAGADRPHAADAVNNKIRYGEVGIWIYTDSVIKNCTFNWINECSVAGIKVENACEITNNGIWQCVAGIDIRDHPSGRVCIQNNSIKANKIASTGISRSTTDSTSIINTIISGNTIGITGTTGGELLCDYNCLLNTTNFSDPLFHGANDFINLNPQFVPPPMNFVWDRDWRFYLKQIPAQNCSVDCSPCVNSGMGTSYGGTTATNHMCDFDIVDRGAHLMDCN